MNKIYRVVGKRIGHISMLVSAPSKKAALAYAKQKVKNDRGDDLEGALVLRSGSDSR